MASGTWIKLYDNFWENPKVLAAGEDAALLYVQGLSYCSRNLTDGAIPTPALRLLTSRPKADRLAERLVDAGLWDRTGTGWQIHGYADVQRTRAEVEQLRSRATRRASIHRNPALKQAIRDRDGDLCRYCGAEVVWTDRRGALGATYDHVDPSGPDTLENLVTACRGCNSAKRSRTPEQAGMRLRQPKSVLSTEPSQGQVRDLPEVETDTETDPYPYPSPDDFEGTTHTPEQRETNLAAIHELKSRRSSA